ncbi:MAG: RidA family protein [Candidatus Limnocylindrales bacterium]
MQKTFVNPKDIYETPWKFNEGVKITRVGTILFCAGIVGWRPDGSIATGDIVAQAEQAYSSLKRIVEEAGGTLHDVVKTNVYVGENYMIHREALRDVRARFFSGDDVPATTLLQVAGFANPGYMFEIEAIAVLQD